MAIGGHLSSVHRNLLRVIDASDSLNRSNYIQPQTDVCKNNTFKDAAMPSLNVNVRSSLTHFCTAGTLSLAAFAAQAAPVLGISTSSISYQASGGNLAAGENCVGPTIYGSGLISGGCSVGDGGTGTLGYEATANAIAGMGAIHASTTGHATSTTTLGTGATLNVGTTDYFAIHGIANSSGILNGSFVISGGVGATVNGSPDTTTAAGSSYSAQLSLNSANASQSGGITLGTNGYHEESNVGGGTHLIHAPIFFGADGWAVVSLSMYVQLNSNGTARGAQACSTCPLIAGAYSTEAGFADTIYWGGISSITIDGVELTDYELVSASGANYRYSTDVVPIPAAIWLFGSSLIGLGGLKRRS
ncbi:MAG: VPLPA-CTERM sorting domain-containing protein [Spongiibacteraceae bacterium]